MTNRIVSIKTGPIWSHICVMLKLTKKADYGLIALKHLAVRTGEGSASAKEIAETYGIPAPLLSKILQKMGRAGFLRSEHGTNGGYRLARDPGRLSVLEVIRAIDGPIILTNCFTELGDCDHTSRCTVREPLRRIHEAILSLLDSISIAEIARDGAEDEGVCSVEAMTALSQAGLTTIQNSPRKPVQ